MKIQKAQKYVICCLFLCLCIVNNTFADTIIPDGNTNTYLSINGNVTNIQTQTVKGKVSFNSFEKFNISEGNIVNLHLPGRTNSLINIVNSETSDINGMLNSFKDNVVGGNVFFVNPFGLTIGSQGVINVGCLTVLTPTIDFTNTFFNSVGRPDKAHIKSVLSLTAPINQDAIIYNSGTINTINDFKATTGQFVNNGSINTNAYYEPVNDPYNIQTEDIVNLNNQNTSPVVLTVDGNIFITTLNSVVNTGELSANANITLKAENTVSVNENSKLIAGKNVNIKTSADAFIGSNANVKAGKNIVLNSINGDAIIAGQAEVESGKKVILKAANNALIYDKASVKASEN